jgi:hypothetical protein
MSDVLFKVERDAVHSVLFPIERRAVRRKLFIEKGMLYCTWHTVPGKERRCTVPSKEECCTRLSVLGK